MADQDQDKPAEPPLEKGGSGAGADFATGVRPDDLSSDTPYARPAPPLKPDETPDQLAERRKENRDNG